MNGDAGDKVLMVVVTRAYADLNSNNDEFVHEWGFEAYEGTERPLRHVWAYEDDSVALLVVHGCKHPDADPADTVEKALSEREREVGDCGTISEAWLFQHSLDEQKLHAVETAIQKSLVTIKDLKTRGYNSRGGTAVEALEVELGKENGTGLPPASFKTAMSNAATGRRILAARLSDLRADLLRLRLLFDAVLLAGAASHSGDREGNIDVEQAFTNQADVISRSIQNTISEEESDLWKRWQAEFALCPDWPAMERALAHLRTLEEPPAPPWQHYHTDRSWAREQADNAAQIRGDLCSFARHVDILIGALDHLPPRPSGKDGDGATEGGGNEQ